MSAVIGGGLAGLATALRLQADGLSTVVLEAHGHAGGCAGYYRKQGFSFDVGATTLVDFTPGGVGAELLESVGIGSVDALELPGYRAFLPDREVTLYRDQAAWRAERLRMLGDTERHQRFWALLDRLAETFWRASRSGIRLPVRTAADALHDLRAIGLAGVPLSRYLTWTVGDALRRYGLRDDVPLVGLLAMLIEDTVHATVDSAPLINAALGITIRGAGLQPGCRRDARLLARTCGALPGGRQQAPGGVRGVERRRCAGKLPDHNAARSHRRTPRGQRGTGGHH